MRSKKAIEERYFQLKDELQSQKTFFVEDAEHIWTNLKKSSVYWYLSAMLEIGYIKRVRKGMYALASWESSDNVFLSSIAKRAKDIIEENGFYYYISGLDILSGYMLHVPEQYPVLLFAEKEAKDEVTNLLQKNGLFVVYPLQIKDLSNNPAYQIGDHIPVVLYTTGNFEYCKDGLAEKEKAFVDLYYAVTRNEYPLAIQELVRIYENLIRTGGIDGKRMIRAASLRSIQYDIRFIAESKYITAAAKKFEKILNDESSMIQN